MADKRDDREQHRGERRDLESERRFDRRAEPYRGSDERGYGGGERLGREWEMEEPGGPERSGRGERLRSSDEERFERGGPERYNRDWEERGFREAPRDHGERRFRDSGRDRDVLRASRWDREDLRTSPSGSFHDELREERERPRRYGDRSRPTSLPYETERWNSGYGGDVGRLGPERGRYGFGTRGIGEVTDREGHHRHYSLAGLHDLDDLSELRERYHERRSERDYEPRYGHGPGIENMEAPRVGYGTSMTRDISDRDLGHGGMLGDTYRAGSPRPLGRAPKGYQRSDDRIREDICDRLMMSWMNAENVDVLVKNGEVTLQGTVKSRDEKRAIEALAESVLGVKDITNALRVEREGQGRVEARPEVRGEPMPQTQNLKDRPQGQDRRAQEQEQTSAQKPGDTSLHS
ncbi:BON domain-containing protein [Hyalangium versicolor]|uniref:BON domain-containing protein n=1 Tax=Hyalangium versicolor TaxID=2861190 RepID=UPI001CD0212F|nr:BON domain-containing protein [Hyalangium versicolor]